jgi:hypothetical protein
MLYTERTKLAFIVRNGSDRNIVLESDPENIANPEPLYPPTPPANWFPQLNQGTNTDPFQ